MATFFKTGLILSFLLLTACAEQPTVKKPAQPKPTVAAKPAQPAKSTAPAQSAKPAEPAKPTSNVRVSENEGPSNSLDGAYYVQNRILSSGGAVSGAMMGS